MIRSDPAECAMESRIAHEWDILGTVLSIYLPSCKFDLTSTLIRVCLSNSLYLYLHLHLSHFLPIYNLPIHLSAFLSPNQFIFMPIV